MATTVIRLAAWVIAWDEQAARHVYRQDVDVAFTDDRIAFIGRSTSRLVNESRERGYREALSNAGVPIDPMLILDGDGTTESGRQSAEHMFVRDVLPSAFRSEERRVGKECRSRWSPYH